MNPTLILTLSPLVLVIKLATCSYQPWEGIMKWYSDEQYQFDKEEANTKQSEMVNNCTAHVGSNEGLCFDDCMFKIQYRLIRLYVDYGNDSQWEYFVIPLWGLESFEQNVLELKYEEEIVKDVAWYDVGDPEPRNKMLTQRLLTCTTKLHFHVNDASDYYSDVAKNMCTQLLNEQELETMASIVNCVKEQLTNI